MNKNTFDKRFKNLNMAQKKVFEAIPQQGIHTDLDIIRRYTELHKTKINGSHLRGVLTSLKKQDLVQEKQPLRFSRVAVVIEELQPADEGDFDDQPVGKFEAEFVKEEPALLKSQPVQNGHIHEERHEVAKSYTDNLPHQEYSVGSYEFDDFNRIATKDDVINALSAVSEAVRNHLTVINTSVVVLKESLDRQRNLLASHADAIDEIALKIGALVETDEAKKEGFEEMMPLMEEMAAKFQRLMAQKSNGGAA